MNKQKMNINEVEYNAILFYSDVLSLEEQSIPFTESCKYFFIYNSPMHIFTIAGLNNDVDISNRYFKQSYDTYVLLRDKYGEEGIETFINNICSIAVSGMVDAERILKCIH